MDAPTSPTQVGRRLAWLLLLFAAAVAGFAVNYRFFVRTALGQEIDEAALVGGERVPQGVFGEGWEILDIISVASLALACAVIAAVALARRRVALAFAAMAAIGGANVATQVLKKGLLERPDLIGAGDMNSLPSGHATVAASVAVGIVMVTAPRWRSTTATVASLFPIAIGVAVVAAGWHRPSDSIAAFCVVLGAAAVSLAVVVALFGYEPGARPPPWYRRSILVLVGAATIVLGGTGFLGLWALRDRLRDGPIGPRWESVAYASAAAAIVATAIVVMMSLVLALRGMAVGQGGWDKDGPA